jgi:hypothetical protein
MNNSRRVQVATTKTKYESLRDERVDVFNMIRQLSPKELVSGQFRTLRAVRGDEPCEKETQMEMELEAESALTMRSAA